MPLAGVSTPERWETFAHGSDVGVRGVGATAERAFEQAAVALTSLITDPARVAAERTVEIACRADDLETLLVEFLDALIFELATRKLLCARCEVRIEGNELRARAHGERLDVARHEPAVEPKGATYTELRVARAEDGTWIAQCVVDV